MIRIFSLLLIVALPLAAGEAAALAPHRGTVVQENRSFVGVWIISETLDNLVHTLDQRPDSPPTTLPRGRYVRVDYERPEHVEWLRGDNLANEGKWAEAAARFLAAAQRPDTWYTRESAWVRAAEAFVKAQRADDALRALDELLRAAPKTIFWSQALYLRGQALRAKGDNAGALRAYDELAKRPEIDIQALAALGRAEVLGGDGKHEDAAKALAAVFGKLDAERHPRAHADVGFALAAAQRQANQRQEAIATLRQLAFGAADIAIRARAHLEWARLLAADDTSLVEAFDQAAIAMSLRGPPDISAAASQLAKQLSQRFDRLPDSQMSSDTKAEYRRYLTR
ncbi:MAG: tetratricopeptide repeat protein [Planctomycetota bacterium]|nr:tetratricopeptide repeat protein [Planctomycetota bacterium]MCX8039546.1 tetratricopeptide repeat protein [Planctomycetota bacterium]MDW8373369.1 tetratricopeptide repeat protein [Planctomycetota bacterium]